MLKRFWLIVVMCSLWVGSAQAQNEVVFIQVEAKRNLAEALEAAKKYSSTIADVNGFRLGRGWYALTLGPYRRDDAVRVLEVYQAENVIPRDSFITQTSIFGQQFWPVGANILGRGALPIPNAAARDDGPDVSVVQTPTTPAPEPEPEPTVTTPIQIIDETPREARASERQLNGNQRRELQIALRWAGVYDNTIDGLFGAGTRRSMSAWQEQNGYEATGILTTLQRNDLVSQYNAVLEELGLQLVRDDTAGIEIEMPLNVVGFKTHIAPFGQYPSKAGGPENVILISQAGDQTTLFGLYDILQTLDIVPANGPRKRSETSFSITGRSDEIVTEVRASLSAGEIKGFILVWPLNDEPRRKRLLAEMEASFQRTAGVLPADAGLDEAQSIDLVSGLDVRKPRVSRSGFFVDEAGSVVTTSEVIQSCSRLTLDTETEAEIAALDTEKGIAILRPKQGLAPIGFGRFSTQVPRLQSEIAVAGYSFEGILGAPSMTFGTLIDLRGLRGEAELSRLALGVLPGDAGGPVLDTTGGVLGMLLPRASDGRALPDEVNFAINSDAIERLLNEANVTGATNDDSTLVDPVDLTETAQNMTVLVSCWD
ncbi:MAG: serine protease [Paracoccaceae bacterium]